MESQTARDQRPFHICPDCSAHNAKFNPRCWRCDRDMAAGALSPTGVIGYRLNELETASKASDAND